ncbi:MAG: glycosyltransferase family 2 protein [Candidatus Moranbacteria bacterium]|nr:glycosyltransferase family 2 protein [Candidatus Moranbacteria bacterium]
MGKKKLSIIIPVYNEERTVEKLLEKIYELAIPGFEKELIIVEDNSKDNSRAIVRDFCRAHRGCKLILGRAPRGKGTAVRRGLKYASGDVLAIQDADLEYDVNDYPKLLKPFAEGKAKFVLGSRHLNDEGNKNRMIRKFRGLEKIFYGYLMNVGGVFLHKLFNVLYGTKISDPTTMYKIFTRDLYEKVHLTGRYFDLDFEIVAKFVRLGYIPLEIPIKYESRGFGEGKKIKLSRDIPKWLVMIFKCRFLPKNKL